MTKFALNLFLLTTALTWSCTAGAQSIYEPYYFFTFAGSAGAIGSADGTGSVARFNAPQGVAIGTDGIMYVADTGSNTIRKITTAAVVTTLAGSAGVFGSADGTGSAASFGLPQGVAVDNAGFIYVGDSANNTIRRITPAGVVTTFAGLAGSAGSADGTGSVARFSYPIGLATDTAGNIYVADNGNSTIRKITPGGVVSTLAGLAGSPGTSDGVGSGARFAFPSDVAVDSADNIYVADTGNITIRKIAAGAVVTTIAGSPGATGSTDGTGSAARFNGPRGLDADNAGNVYVADTGNSIIRKITSAGSVTTLAGLASSLGSTDGAGSTARFSFPRSLALNSAGQIGVVDTNNHTIRLSAPLPNIVSRKTHGAAGTFSIPLPLTGAAGVEDRTGNGGVAGTHTIVLSFTSNPAGANASVTAHNPPGATGSVSNVSFVGNDMIVDLTGVSDRQVLTLSVSGGAVSPAGVPIGFLVGDVNNNHSVSSSDIGQVKAQSGTPNATTFRSDVNANGSINATDISIVKANAGGSIP